VNQAVKFRSLDPDAAKRLAKLCGMFGSHHDGERAAAAALADKLARASGLTWPEIFGLEPGSISEKLELLRRHLDELTRWECQFVINLPGFRHLPRKQLEVLDRLVAKVRDLKEARAA
jgi:hypothetical protein